MRNPFTEHKKNRIRSRLRTLRLFFVNRRSHEPVVAGEGPVVSLTSYGPRLPIVYLAIESIGAGALKPSRLILWLAEQERNAPLPKTLIRLLARGLEIQYCEDLGPHKKYFPYVQSRDSFDVPLVTADDDVIYPSYWLSELDAAYRAFPEQINCLRAKRIQLSDGGLASYDDWPSCTGTSPSVLHFATGVSGVVYPPSFQSVLKRAGDGFRAVCPRADDVWLHVNALRHGYRIRQARPRPIHFAEILGTQRSSLNRSNVKGGGNDAQIQATYQPDDLLRLRQAAASAE